MNKESKHALLSPSAAKIWYTCPGSVVLSKDIPALPPSIHALEGTQAHEYAEKSLRAMLDEEFDNIDDALEHVGVDNTEQEEMYGHVKSYVEFCLLVKEKFFKGKKDCQVFVEKKIKLSQNIYGTADFCLVGRDKKTEELHAVIIDLKYGKGVEVEVEGNLQLATYAVCLSSEYDNEFTKIFAYIYQPRTPGKEYYRWVIEQAALVNWGKNFTKAEKTILSMLTGSVAPKLFAGDLQHCRFCRAKVKCPEFKKAVEKDAQIVLEKDGYPKVINTPVATLVEIFKRKKAIEHFLDDVEGYLTFALEKGQEVPGYKLVSGRRQRRWIKGEEERIAKELGQLGVAEPWRQSLITIGQAEKEIGKNAEDKISGLVNLTALKLQIAPVDDKRTGIDVASEVAGLLTDISSE